MKVIADFFAESISGIEVLSEDVMNNIRGGVVPPKSRDKDVFDFEEE
ncbi:hypothetical protein SLH46_11945 [Draconibacterium sp. IB214405]|nr:hypothetical protein [Draconibacterium sp. IB214405]MDX8339901.1 hypothetical protein [Draconibacterium sp. IB214405]